MIDHGDKMDGSGNFSSLHRGSLSEESIEQASRKCCSRDAISIPQYQLLTEALKVEGELEAEGRLGLACPQYVPGGIVYWLMLSQSLICPTSPDVWPFLTRLE